MSFWSTEFMNDRRNDWLKALVLFEYRVGDAWYKANQYQAHSREHGGSHREPSQGFHRITDYHGGQDNRREGETVRLPRDEGGEGHEPGGTRKI